jgi:hypothetical protein
MEPHHPEAASSSPAQMRCTMADRELIAAIFLAGLLVEAADNLINALAATPGRRDLPEGLNPSRSAPFGTRTV